MEFLRARREQGNALADQRSGAGRVRRGHLGAGRADGDRRNFRSAAGRRPLFLPPDPAAGGGGAGDRHDACAHRQSAPRAIGISPWVDAPSFSASCSLAAAGDRGDVARRAGQRMDRQGAGDRRGDQAEALRARSAVGRIARAAGGRCCRRRETPSRSSHRNWASSPRSLPSSRRRWLQITLFFVTLIFFLATQMDFRRYMVSFFTEPRRQASLHPHHQRHRGSSCVLRRRRDRSSISAWAWWSRSARGCSASRAR